MNYEDLSPEEQLHIENQVLRLKLQIETNAKLISSESNLPPEIENAWLKNVYNFEKNFEDAPLRTVYEHIGKPEFKALSEIKADELDKELTGLLDLMFSKGIVLVFMPKCYEAKVLYRFVTEELFQQEGRFPAMEGEGKWVYNYEEFYPNHHFDLWRHSMDYMEVLFGELEWQAELLGYSHLKTIRLNGNEIPLEEYSAAIITFKENYPHVLFTGYEIADVSFELETGKARVICEAGMPKEKITFTIHYQKEYEWWLISGLEMTLV